MVASASRVKTLKPVWFARFARSSASLSSSRPFSIAGSDNIPGQVEVVIVTGCQNIASEEVTVSDEHKEVGLFRLDQLDEPPMPDGYRESIKRWTSSRGLQRD